MSYQSATDSRGYFILGALYVKQKCLASCSVQY